ADNCIRFIELSRRPEIASVKMERSLEIFRREVGREGERQPELSCKPRAEIARAEKIKRDVQTGAGNSLNSGVRPGEVRLQFEDVLRKGVAVAAEVAA